MDIGSFQASRTGDTSPSYEEAEERIRTLKTYITRKISDNMVLTKVITDLLEMICDEENAEITEQWGEEIKEKMIESTFRIENLEEAGEKELEEMLINFQNDGEWFKKKATDLQRKVIEKGERLERTSKQTEDKTPEEVPSHLEDIVCPAKIFKCNIRNSFVDRHDSSGGFKFKTFTLCDGYQEVILGGNASDVTIAVNGYDFPVHRAVLRNCSSFFVERFDLNENDAIQVDGCDAEVFDHFLFFAYCGKFNSPPSRILRRLYYAAEKFQVPELKQLSADSLNALTEDTVCDVIHLAHIHGDACLLERATTFFARNAERVLATAEWESFFKENMIEANQLLIEALKLRPYKDDDVTPNKFTEMVYRRMVDLTRHPENQKE